MLFETLLERNRAFVKDRAARPLPPAENLALAVVACYDPRLDDLLRPALGIAPGSAFLIRTGGALVQPGSSSLRSLALAVFMFGVPEVLIVGHSSCRMASFDSSAFIDAFRRRGVPREAFGGEDLRTWVGAIPDPRRGVQQSVANIAAAPFMPKDLLVGGVVLDDTTGALEVVVRPGAVAPTPATTAPPPKETAVPPVAPPPAAAAEVKNDPLVAAIAGLVDSLESAAGLQPQLRALRAEIQAQPDARVKLRFIETFLQQAAADSEEVARAYTRFRQQAAAARRRWNPEDLVRHFLARPRTP